MKYTLKIAFASAALIAVGLSAPASADPIVQDFQVLEISDCGPGCGFGFDFGHFTLINNTADLKVMAFAVGNSSAFDASTTQSGWDAGVQSNVGIEHFVSFSLFYGYSVGDFSPETPGFNVSADNPALLGTGSYSNFFWDAGHVESPFLVIYLDAQGEVGFFEGEAEGGSVPNPGALALFALGLLGIAATRRRFLN